VVKKNPQEIDEMSPSMSPIHFRPGYKGYINGIRKDCNKGTKKSDTTGGKENIANQKLRTTIEAGDVEMNAQMTPGGTITVQAPSDTEMENLYIHQGEEYSDDDDEKAADDDLELGDLC
jgi:hypothetical protein